MPYTMETVNGKIKLKIEGPLTIYAAPAIYGEFLSWFESGGEVTVDVEAVTECDTAGLQLLCAACKNARENRQLFEVLGASEAITGALQHLGMNADEIGWCPSGEE